MNTTWLRVLLLLVLGAASVPAQDTGETPTVDDARYEARRSWNKARRGFDRKLREAEPADRAAIIAERTATLSAALEPLWAILEKQPKDEDGPKALLWILRQGKYDAAQGERAAKMFAIRHADHDDAYRAARTLAGVNEAWADAPLARLAEKGNARAKAWAHYAGLARKLAAAKTADAETPLIDALQKLAGEVKDQKDVASAIALKLQPYRFAPGRPAPEISGVDLDGTSFNLSDYRGKVVLLDFWGTW